MFAWFQKRRLARQHYVRTDFGRIPGWWLRLDGVRVAELNYRRWDEHMQFWHEYDLVPLSEKFAQLGIDPDRWAQADVSAESRYAPGYVSSTGLLMAPRDEGIVSLRSLWVSKGEFIAAYLKMHSVQDR